MLLTVFTMLHTRFGVQPSSEALFTLDLQAGLRRPAGGHVDVVPCGLIIATIISNNCLTYICAQSKKLLCVTNNSLSTAVLLVVSVASVETLMLLRYV